MHTDDNNNNKKLMPPRHLPTVLPHPSSIPPLPTQPATTITTINTNTQQTLPYTPTTPLPSSQFQTPAKTTKYTKQQMHSFDSVQEEENEYASNTKITTQIHTHNNNNNIRHHQNINKHKLT